MIKKLLFAVMLALPICISAQALKFGTVNSAEIFNVMPDKATAEATLKAASEKYDAEFKRLQEDFQKDYLNLHFHQNGLYLRYYMLRHSSAVE